MLFMYPVTFRALLGMLARMVWLAITQPQPPHAFGSPHCPVCFHKL